MWYTQQQDSPETREVFINFFKKVKYKKKQQKKTTLPKHKAPQTKNTQQQVALTDSLLLLYQKHALKFHVDTCALKCNWIPKF